MRKALFIYTLYLREGGSRRGAYKTGFIQLTINKLIIYKVTSSSVSGSFWTKEKTVVCSRRPRCIGLNSSSEEQSGIVSEREI